jgi:hypothetical protein
MDRMKQSIERALAILLSRAPAGESADPGGDCPLLRLVGGTAVAEEAQRPDPEAANHSDM